MNDPVGNLNSLVYPNGDTIAYDYNPNDWLSTVADPNGNVTLYDYNPNGQVTQISYGNNTWADYSYDAAGRLTDMYAGTPSGGGGLLRSYVYTLDKVGNRVQTVEQYTQGQVQTIVRDYEYDALYRLTSAVEEYDSPQAEVITSTYAYDAAGNRLEMTTNRPQQGGPPPSPQTTAYAYNHEWGDDQLQLRQQW